MKTITVGELRQNPTAMLAEVEAGETYRVTRHGREVGRMVPPQTIPGLIPAKKRGGARTSELPPLKLKGGITVEQLLEEMKGEW